jgi:hypothetical protein
MSIYERHAILGMKCSIYYYFSISAHMHPVRPHAHMHILICYWWGRHNNIFAGSCERDIIISDPSSSFFQMKKFEDYFRTLQGNNSSSENNSSTWALYWSKYWRGGH